MRRLLFLLALCATIAVPSAAFADTFDFNATGSGGGFSGSGSFVATKNTNNSFTITSISGTGITGLIGVGQFNNNDNLLFPNNSSVVDTNGFAFTDLMQNTSFKVDIFANGTGGYNAFLLDSDGFSETVPVSLSLTNTTPTPEPSSLILVGTGLLGGIAAVRRKYCKI